MCLAILRLTDTQVTIEEPDGIEDVDSAVGPGTSHRNIFNAQVLNFSAKSTEIF
jgi:hypothetical protein